MTYRCPEHGQTDCSPLLNGCNKVIEHHQAQAPEDKAWPPSNLEQKTPQVDTK